MNTDIIYVMLLLNRVSTSAQDGRSQAKGATDDFGQDRQVKGMWSLEKNAPNLQENNFTTACDQLIC